MLGFSIKRLSLALFCAGIFGAPTARAETPVTDFDNRAAVIFAYTGVGLDDNPSISVTNEQFARQIEELTSGAYHVLPLPDIIAKFKKNAVLPDRTIALTFDGADTSVLTAAAPLLIKARLPFTIFVPAERVDKDKQPYLSWDDLRDLKKTGLVTFGLNPSGLGRLVSNDAAEIRRQINNGIVRLREELGISPTLLAYPYGEYDLTYQQIVGSMGFDAAFGQQSGVAWSGDNLFALPRFAQSERYGDQERFVMTANALPLPVKDVSPQDPHLSTLTPVIGFTLPETLAKAGKNLSCFSSSDEKPSVTLLRTRVEIRMPGFDDDRPRINCTLPVAGNNGEDTRWRWFGMMLTVPERLLEKQETQDVQKHAADTPDWISVE